jgi:hypothetical protein
MMAKSKSTKSLKAKTTARHAAKSRPKPASCQVTEIAKRQISLINAIGAVAMGRDQHAPNSSDYRAYEADYQLLNDRLVSNRDAASYLTPKTPMGAAFLLLSLHTDALNMVDAPDRQHYFRRLERSAWALRRWMEREHGIDFRMRWGWHYMGGEDPANRLAFLVGK